MAGYGKMCCMIVTLIVSVWGAIMLMVLGIMFKTKSLMLMYSISELSELTEPEEYVKEIHKKADSIGASCWLAAAIYAITAVVMTIFLLKMSKKH